MNYLKKKLMTSRAKERNIKDFFFEENQTGYFRIDNNFFTVKEAEDYLMKLGLSEDDSQEYLQGLDEIL